MAENAGEKNESPNKLGTRNKPKVMVKLNTTFFIQWNVHQITQIFLST
jgi:hypothetical protein